MSRDRNRHRRKTGGHGRFINKRKSANINKKTATGLNTLSTYWKLTFDKWKNRNPPATELDQTFVHKYFKNTRRQNQKSTSQQHFKLAKRASDVMIQTRLGQTNWNGGWFWRFLKAGVPKRLVKRKRRLHSLHFPQNTHMLIKSCGEFSDLHSIFRLCALRYWRRGILNGNFHGDALVPFPRIFPGR